MNKLEIEIDDIIFELNKDDNTVSIIKFDQTEKVIAIPESIQYESKNYPVTTISDKAIQNETINYFYISENIVEFKDGWCQLIKILNNIKISPKNAYFTYFDQKLILGKSISKSEIYDMLIFAIRNLVNIAIPSFIRIITPFSFSNCKKLKKIEFSEDSELESIGNFAFADLSIEDISIPNTVRFFGTGWCKNTLKLKKIQIKSTKKIPETKNFVFCEKQKILVQESDSEDEKQFILIYANNKIKNVIIPDSINIIPSFCFYRFKNLTKVDFSQSLNLHEIQQNSFSETLIKSIEIPSQVTKIGKYAFMKCKKLELINFCENSKLIEIDENAFCETAIEHIYIPSTVNKIGKYAFLNCRKLQIISFKENSELIEIEKNAFSGTIIEAIKIPSNIKKVHKSAFDCCKKLKVIDIPEQLGFNPLNNILLSKFRYEIKLGSHEFGHIIQKAGILSFICHYEDSLEKVISCLELPKTINIFSSFKSQFSIKLNDFFCFMNKFDIYSLHPSIGMMCAYRVIEQKLTLNDLYLELLDKNNCSKFEFYFIKKYSDENSYLHTFNNFCNFNGNKSMNISNCKLSNDISKYKKNTRIFLNMLNK